MILIPSFVFLAGRLLVLQLHDLKAVLSFVLFQKLIAIHSCSVLYYIFIPEINCSRSENSLFQKHMILHFIWLQELLQFISNTYGRSFEKHNNQL